MFSSADSQELGSQLAYVRGSQNSQPLELLHSDTTKDIFVALSTDEKCVSLSMGYSKPWGQFNSSGIESLHPRSVLFSLLMFSLNFSSHLHTRVLNHRSVQFNSSEDEDGSNVTYPSICMYPQAWWVRNSCCHRSYCSNRQSGATHAMRTFFPPVHTPLLETKLKKCFACALPPISMKARSMKVMLIQPWGPREVLCGPLAKKVEHTCCIWKLNKYACTWGQIYWCFHDVCNETLRRSWRS